MGIYFVLFLAGWTEEKDKTNLQMMHFSVEQHENKWLEKEMLAKCSTSSRAAVVDPRNGQHHHVRKRDGDWICTSYI